MNLVPENINEAIKHLKPRSDEELGLDDLKSLSDSKLFDIWMHCGNLKDFTPLDIRILKELKRRNSSILNSTLKATKWYIKHRDKIAQLLNEL